MNEKRYVHYAYDIDRSIVRIDDIVSITKERIDKYNSIYNKVGETLRVAEIYTVPSYWGEEVMGTLYYTDGSGSIFNSDLTLFRKVT